MRWLICNRAAAKARFEEYVKLKTSDDPNRQRALRYISRPELVRARLAPPFAVTTIDGQKISRDDTIAKLFGVRAIPHTFTIDADGALQEEHVGDASLEGKIKKLLARAHEMRPAEKLGT